MNASTGLTSSVEVQSRPKAGRRIDRQPFQGQINEGNVVVNQILDFLSSGRVGEGVMNNRK